MSEGPIHTPDQLVVVMHRFLVCTPPVKIIDGVKVSAQVPAQNTEDLCFGDSW